MRLLAPAAGAVLEAESEVLLEWEPEAVGLALLEAPVEEWEAFLSVNGGQTYAFRLTPHLDIDLPSFRFTVPAVQSTDVRILLRFGNERREVGFEMPQQYSIVAPAPAAFKRRVEPVRLSGRGRGEAARPGEPGVLTWVEGTRRGRDLSWRTAGLPARIRSSTLVSGTALILVGTPTRRDETRFAGSADAGAALLRAGTGSTRPVQDLSRSLAILLLIQRSNR